MAEDRQQPRMPTIHEAVVRVQAEVESVARTAAGQVGNQKFKYADLEGVMEMIKPIKAKHGIALIQYVDGDYLYAKIIHESGSDMDVGKYHLGPFTKSQDRGKDITYGRRYQECAVWGIVQEEDPDKAQSAWPSKKARETYRLTVLNKIDVSVDEEDLKAIWTGHGKKINEMQNSPNGDDQLAAQEIFALLSVKRKEFEQRTRLEREADNVNFEALNANQS